MKKWYSLIPDGTMDYAVQNRETGEIEAIIAKVNLKSGFNKPFRYLRFVRNESGEWEQALFNAAFFNLADVRKYYDNVHH